LPPLMPFKDKVESLKPLLDVSISADTPSHQQYHTHEIHLIS
jgi:hypothetical protein